MAFTLWHAMVYDLDIGNTMGLVSLWILMSRYTRDRDTQTIASHFIYVRQSLITRFDLNHGFWHKDF